MSVKKSDKKKRKEKSEKKGERAIYLKKKKG